MKIGRVGRSATVIMNCRHMVSLVSYKHFMVLENIPNPSPSKKEGSEVGGGGWGHLKTKTFQEKYETKLKSPEGWVRYGYFTEI